jgi:hypothetical protein
LIDHKIKRTNLSSTRFAQSSQLRVKKANQIY